jgi:hypothetical protein
MYSLFIYLLQDCTMIEFFEFILIKIIQTRNNNILLKLPPLLLNTTYSKKNLKVYPKFLNKTQ